MTRRFAKVLEEEIEEAFFYPSDLVNTSRLGIYPPLFTSPSGDSCIIYMYISSVNMEGMNVATATFPSFQVFEQ